MSRAWRGDESTGVKGHSRLGMGQETEDHTAHPGKAVGMGSGAQGEGEQKTVGFRS